LRESFRVAVWDVRGTALELIARCGLQNRGVSVNLPREKDDSGDARISQKRFFQRSSDTLVDGGHCLRRSGSSR
jgi:hypothetical protein